MWRREGGEACAQSKCRLSRSMSELIEGIVMKQNAMHAWAVRIPCIYHASTMHISCKRIPCWIQRCAEPCSGVIAARLRCDCGVIQSWAMCMLRMAMHVHALTKAAVRFVCRPCTMV